MGGEVHDGSYNLAESSKEDEISVNFYEALLGFSLNAEGTVIEITPEWAPGIPVSSGMPEKISLSNRYYPSIQATVEDLKETVRKKEKIVGRIKRLEAHPDLETRMAGKISVTHVDHLNKARTVTAVLDKKDYEKAIEAHALGSYVEIIGEMTEDNKKEIDCDSFTVLE